MRKRYQIYITGNVQRVGFRNQAFENAFIMGITGKAMYIDHAVMIEAEGEMENLLEFISWCKVGPLSCCIDGFEVTEMPLEYSVDFDIVHGIVSSGKLTDLFSQIN